MTEKREGRPAKLTFLLVQEESFFLQPLEEAAQDSNVILLVLAAPDHIVHVHELRERQITGQLVHVSLELEEAKGDDDGRFVL